MSRICFTYYNMDSDRNSVRNGAALRGGSFCICHIRHTGKDETAETEGERMGIQPLADRRTTGQRWQMLLYGRQGQAPCGVSREKSSSLCCGIFPENLVFPEAFAVKALVVQRAAKPGYSQLKLNQYATDKHRKTVTGSGMDTGDREKEKNPDTGTAHQAARQGSNRSRTCLHAAESGIGNLQPS